MSVTSSQANIGNTLLTLLHHSWITMQKIHFQLFLEPDLARIALELIFPIQSFIFQNNVMRYKGLRNKKGS